jgi:hypothetical protein
MSRLPLLQRANVLFLDDTTWMFNRKRTGLAFYIPQGSAKMPLAELLAIMQRYANAAKCGSARQSPEFIGVPT